MTISASSLTDCTHTLYQILVSFQIPGLGGTSTGFGSYGNIPSSQHVSVILIQEYVW